MSLNFNLAFGGSNGGGGTIDYSRVLEKIATIPSIDTVSIGTMYIYTGATNQLYTHGYIYEVVATEEATAVSFSSNNITWGVSDFVEYLKEGGDSWNEVVSGTLEYLGTDNNLWKLTGYNSNGIQVMQFQEYTEDLEQFGCMFTVAPQDGDSSTFELTTEQDGKKWRRLDVQPGIGSGLETKSDDGNTELDASSGVLTVKTPDGTVSGQIANVDYVNNIVGDIETVLSDI